MFRGSATLPVTMEKTKKFQTPSDFSVNLKAQLIDCDNSPFPGVSLCEMHATDRVSIGLQMNGGIRV
jgi:hypothetical protein